MTGKYKSLVVMARINLEMPLYLFWDVGGLGNPVSLYLATAGIGRLTLVDDDVVSLSNLHRQILFTENDIGLSKAEVAGKSLRHRNTDVEIISVNDRLTAENADKYVYGHDLVIIGSDNLDSRYLVNDMCCRYRIPFINASVLGGEGEFTFFDIENGCYRCVFPEKPPENSIPLPEDIGVLGTSVGVIGTVAATMAVEVIIGNKEYYINKLFVFNSIKLSMKAYCFSKDDNCPACSGGYFHADLHKT